MMMVIQTQYMENYGYSDGTDYWKFKGCYEYKITGVPEGVNKSDLYQAAMRLIEYSNEASREYTIGFTMESDDYLSQFERSQLEFDGSIAYPEKVIPFDSIKMTEETVQ